MVIYQLQSIICCLCINSVIKFVHPQFVLAPATTGFGCTALYKCIIHAFKIDLYIDICLILGMTLFW